MDLSIGIESIIPVVNEDGKEKLFAVSFGSTILTREQLQALLDKTHEHTIIARVE